MVTGLSPLRVIPMIDDISYMVDFRPLLMWLDPFIPLDLRLRLRAPPRGIHPHFHLKRSFFMSNEHEDYLHLTQAVKSIIVAYVAQINNAYASI